ncbi:MAG: PDDEXK nuclease domain-containing protein [Candidatus Methanoplasma sp.]|jgi:predicted nuclease of restriction endonuclease-like (RecB) superfamily|nr:PDDEXK nuclease domain-containing protein [Candidatus Methanoplasma sp.]
MNQAVHDDTNMISRLRLIDDFVKGHRATADTSSEITFRSVNVTMLQRRQPLSRNASLRKTVKENMPRIVETGKGCSDSNLHSRTQFYRVFPEIFYSVSKQSSQLLSWTHYRILLQVHDSNARNWYLQEAAEQTWSVRTLQRNISTQYYRRMLKAPDAKPVKGEIKELAADYETDRLIFIKDPVIAEFLGFSENSDYNESDLETGIINNLQKFLMELGKGYAFVARQQHIHTEKQEYYIDLVFYNIYLKCYVLIDLKTAKVTHQDVGQMDMYVRMYDELKRVEGDNPTLGIVLCTDTDKDIARYSVLRDNKQLFASKYKLFLPSEEELRAEIEAQKEIFKLRKLDETFGGNQ